LEIIALKEAIALASEEGKAASVLEVTLVVKEGCFSVGSSCSKGRVAALASEEGSY
jgi:hypothetical protein